MITLTDLNEMFNWIESVKDTPQEPKYFGIIVKTDNGSTEYIINPVENLKFKRNDYNDSYDEDLTLKYYKRIKIVGFSYGNTLEEAVMI